MPYRKLGPRATSIVFSLTAAAMFIFLGLGAAIARADVIAAQFGDSLGGTSPDNPVPFLLQTSVEPDAAGQNPNQPLGGPEFAQSTHWNGLLATTTQSGPISFSDLLDAKTGLATSASLSIANIDGASNTVERGSHAGELPDTFLFSNINTDFTFSGLAPDKAFTLFIYAQDPVFPRQEAVFAVGSSTFDTGNGVASSLDADCCVTGVVTGTTDATGAIHGTWGFGADNAVGQIAWSGFQLDVVPEPSEGGLVAIVVGLILLGVRRQTKVHARQAKAPLVARPIASV